jgi:hypothetical protein
LNTIERLTLFLYLLMRDALPTGEVARLVKEAEWVPPHKDCNCGECVDRPNVYTAKGLETYARDLAKRVVVQEETAEAVLDQLGSPTSPCAHVRLRPRCVSCFNRRLHDAEEKVRSVLNGNPIAYGYITNAELKGEYGRMNSATVTVQSGDKRYEFAVPPDVGTVRDLLDKRVALVLVDAFPGSGTYMTPEQSEAFNAGLMRGREDRRARTNEGVWVSAEELEKIRGGGSGSFESHCVRWAKELLTRVKPDKLLHSGRGVWVTTEELEKIRIGMLGMSAPPGQTFESYCVHWADELLARMKAGE